jgi:hypothetical protein
MPITINDRLKPGTWGWRKRQHVNTHNSLKGKTSMAIAAMQAVTGADSVTRETRNLAFQIAAQLEELQRLLGTRINDPRPDET